MPLPKPPAKRAHLLTHTDFESQAAPKPGKRNTKTSLAAEPESPAELSLYDPHTEATASPIVVVDKPFVELPIKRPAQPEPRARKPRGTGPAKLFVLDTNVLMHDPTSLFRFEE